MQDYKKPLEESSPAILNGSKIQTLFHRLPDILQCHLHFRTALADCARTWDRDEKIGNYLYIHRYFHNICHPLETNLRITNGHKGICETVIQQISYFYMWFIG